MTRREQAFLRERGLLRQFKAQPKPISFSFFLQRAGQAGFLKRVSNLSGKRLKKVEATQNGVKLRLLAFREKGKTKVLDFQTLKQVAVTTRYTPKNIRQGIETSKTGKKRIGKEDVIVKRPDVRVSLIEREFTPNFFQTVRQFPLKKKLGKVFLSVTFFKGNNRMTVEGGSRRLRNLSSAREFRMSYDEAFKGAMSQINFSYERFVINWVHYSYFLPRKFAPTRRAQRTLNVRR